MKRVLLAVLASFSVTAMADNYGVSQVVVAPEFALNAAAIGGATKVEQIAQNVGNVAVVKDLDAFGGDNYAIGQTVSAPQTATNNLLVGGVATKIEQTAINFGSDLTIKDAGGTPFFNAQNVNTSQSQIGPQTATNRVATFGAGSIEQVAANTGNTAKIDLPSTPSINNVASGQSVSAPQVAVNLAAVGSVGSFSQTAANAGNAITINQ